jgi:Subtilase family
MPSQKIPKGEASPNTPPRSERELIVVATSEAGLRARRDEVASATGADVASINSILASAGATLVPVFGNEERVTLATSVAPAFAETAYLPDLTSFYRVVTSDEQLEEVASRLAETPLVDGVYIKPAPQPPVLFEDAILPPSPQEAPPVTPSLDARQIYLNAAPAGIDARFAATVAGGKGHGVRIIDIEGAWRFSHEDLVQQQGGVIGGTQSADIGWRNHGTAVIGEFGGDENPFGITGICPLANTRAISIFGAGQGSARAISDAANALSPGDIILIELHAPGPRHNFQNIGGQLGFVAMEFWPDNFAAIVFATSVRGVIVIEAAGNGAENYDDPIYNNRPAGFPTTWRNPFNLSNPQSGAILVGAGAPPPGTHGRNHGADRSRLGFSNFGSRVDVQGWGREVTTAGYGDLQGGSNEDFWYTDVFSGTSSASPIVVGAVGCMQGALRAASKTLLTPGTARHLLRTTGSPQQDEPGRPATQRIGNRPNLREAFTQLGLIQKGKESKEKETRKDVIKDKEIRKELIKDKVEKIERKEIIKEKPEFKERIKDIKDKDAKDLKDFREKPREEFIRTDPQAGTSSSGNLESRIDALEQTVGQLTHFITIELRPDLQSSALSEEADLLALSQQLEKQAADAKSMKDDKDIDKLREV